MFIPVTRDELATLVTALESAEAFAADEARALGEIIRRGELDEHDRRVNSHALREADFRSNRYRVLAERMRHYQSVPPVRACSHYTDDEGG